MLESQAIDERDIFLISCVQSHICLYEKKRSSAEKRNDAWYSVISSMIDAGFYFTDESSEQFLKDIEKSTYFKLRYIIINTYLKKFVIHFLR